MFYMKNGVVDMYIRENVDEKWNWKKKGEKKGHRGRARDEAEETGVREIGD